MARSINFVRERRKTLSKKEEDDRKVLKYVTWGLFGLGVIILLIIGARLFLLYRIQQIEQAQKKAKEQIVALEEVEQQHTIFAHKLKILTELFGKRKEKQEALAYFSNLFDENVMITQLSYTAGKEILTFVLKTDSIFSMEKVFEKINSDEVKQRYPMIQKDSLRRSTDGSYGMQITLMFGDEPTLPEKRSEQDTSLEGSADTLDTEAVDTEDAAADSESDL